jgi:speckle-type POZ protein
VFVEQTNCDVEFLFEDEEKIGGHISILAARSPVFSAMFYHNLQESETGKVFVQDIRPQIFKEMLHYIYSGQTLAPLTDAIAQPLFVVSDKYDIEDLKEKCVRYLLRSVRKSNAVDLLVWANLHSVEKIQEAALDFVAGNFKTICHSNEWENLMKNYPELGFLVTRRYAAV